MAEMVYFALGFILGLLIGSLILYWIARSYIKKKIQQVTDFLVPKKWEDEEVGKEFNIATT